jgi:cobaltochelatase CobS
VKIGFLFPASTIVDIPAGGFNLQRFLDTTIDIWTPNTFIPGIPPKNPGYLFDCRTLVTALSAIRYRKNSLLSGPTGCGKSTVIQQIAARLKRPYYRIPIDGEMRRREILGGWLQEATPTGSKTVWHDGMLTTAYQMPSIILLDEFDHADVDLVVSAHEALERQSLKLVEQPHRDIRMHPGCSITATANTRGAGDPIGIYGVKNRMSEASRNRFTYFISCNYLSISSEAKLLNAQNPNLALSTCEMIAEVASDIRAATIAGNIQTACSTRQTLDIAEDIAIQTEFDTSPVDQLLRKAFNTIMVSRAGDNYEEAAIIGILNAKLGAMP